ncbi:hypothetical protein H8R18_06210 [Nanchangia anserum]|uniref:Uncharacterized protein n=1 Tax=Nanchangia anserum TaxID=2692125 RepID=A0A8I0GE01_9ACTO|nr:hypothetical protein [Nanchangia anserum]MBD3689127.1 hypothetical protein [Nanchangia anserum]QOX81361.1 hypothetical protein H8R18_06210 [Nanchangia anserum]
MRLLTSARKQLASQFRDSHAHIRGNGADDRSHAQRAYAVDGVTLTKAVTDVRIENDVVTVVFDPASVHADRETWDTMINVFDNLAEWTGAPIAFTNDESKALRMAAETVDAVYTDGSSGGSLTKAEIYRMGTGKDLPADER